MVEVDAWNGRLRMHPKLGANEGCCEFDRLFVIEDGRSGSSIRKRDQCRGP